MRCPQCGERETRVVDSRDLDDSATIRRRRECASCSMRFTTYERVEAARLVVVKRDGSRQEFDRDRLASGLRKALTRRPVPVGRGRGGRRRDRGRAARVGYERGPVLEGRRAGDGAAARDRPDRLHPVRQRLPELRGPRDAQARGRHLYEEKGHAGGPRDVSVLSDRDIRAELESGRVVIRPYDSRRPAALVGRPAPRPQLPRLPQQPLSVHRRPGAAAGPDRAADASKRTSRSSCTRASSCSARPSNGSSCPTISSRGSRASRV